MGSRSIWVPADAKGRHQNEATVIARIPAPPAPELEFSFAELFALHYERIRATVLRHLAPGVQLFAIDGRGIRGELWLEAGETLRAASIGRHSRADLVLPGDESLALRHLTLLVRRSGDALMIRLLDLHTTSGLLDESGRRFASLTANGPAFVAAGGFRFFVFPTAAGLSWPHSPADAWLALPRREFLEAEPARDYPAEPRFAVVTHPGIPNPAVAAAPRVDREVTIVRNIAPLPADVSTWLEDGEAPIGHLVVHWTRATRERRAAIGLTAATRGLLLGRYARCELAGFDDEAVSRVHALLLREDSRLHIIDVGSTNGTWHAGVRIQCEPLRPGAVFRMGGDLLVSWEPAS